MSSTKYTNNKELKEIISSGRVSLLINLLNGSLIALFKDVLLNCPGIFILIPGFIQLRGSVYSILTSKISSEIALGRIKIRKNKLSDTKPLIKELFKTNITSIAISTLLGLVSFLLLHCILKTTYPQIISIAIVGSVISSITLSILVYLFIIKVIKKGLDLDIISGPIITSFSDLIGTFCLFITALLFTL